MSTQTSVVENSKRHWALLCLALYQDANGDGATTRELYDAAEGVFDDAKDVSYTCRDLFDERGIVEREPDPNTHRAYRYYLNEQGWGALKRAGEPTQTADGQPIGRGVVSLPAKPPAVKAPTTKQTIDVAIDETGEDPGPFASAKARRRYFAEKRDEDYIEWLESEWRPENTVDDGDDQSESVTDELDEAIALNKRADAGGEIQFEGLDEMMNDVLGQDDSDELRDLPETIDLSPDWDWLGTQLVKLGFVGLAREAFEGKLSPTIVHNDILDTIYKHANDPDVDLDLEAPTDGALTLVESAPDPEEVAQFKQALGIDTESSDTATAS
ncbi:hypothetical protein HUG10_21410 (plasmid) [Halorarum halophilum]|uniref:Uncharacterized protein n=1 Tax=Halorarum halophilum TaxID=2743090 RepID=A0A7D5GHZ1_9EURY|nr:hypothetical protein [Halobaculum halophilum]QLG30148.1 hypothetical protein HUG10_21410 [Halobaculum halophilum]